MSRVRLIMYVCAAQIAGRCALLILLIEYCGSHIDPDMSRIVCIVYST